MKTWSIIILLLLIGCNPEVSKIGSSETDVVKYFKITNKGESSLGEGVLIIAHIGNKKLLTFYLKQPSGKYSHTDVMIRPSGDIHFFEVDSVHSQTPNCKITPDFKQPKYFEEIVIETMPKRLNLEELPREEAMAINRVIGC